MNLYRIWQTVNGNWDTLDSVIAASSEEDARKIHRSESGDWWESEEDLEGWCNLIEQVEFIGTAAPGTKAGVILASFDPS